MYSPGKVFRHLSFDSCFRPMKVRVYLIHTVTVTSDKRRERHTCAFLPSGRQSNASQGWAVVAAKSQREFLLIWQNIWVKWPVWGGQTTCLQSCLGTADAGLGEHSGPPSNSLTACVTLGMSSYITTHVPLLAKCGDTI